MDSAYLVIITFLQNSFLKCHVHKKDSLLYPGRRNLVRMGGEPWFLRKNNEAKHLCGSKCKIVVSCRGRRRTSTHCAFVYKIMLRYNVRLQSQNYIKTSVPAVGLQVICDVWTASKNCGVQAGFFLAPVCMTGSGGEKWWAPCKYGLTSSQVTKVHVNSLISCRNFVSSDSLVPEEHDEDPWTLFEANKFIWNYIKSSIFALKNKCF